jgi:hypothetical protein
VDRERIQQEIALLEERLAEVRAAKPAHDTSGSHQAALLEIEDQLADRQRALAALRTAESAGHEQQATSRPEQTNDEQR